MNRLFGGTNYIGPFQRVLATTTRQRRPRILDMGTGGGQWALDIAHEFEDADVFGVDLAPIQPRDGPMNCSFQICDLDQTNLPYADKYFDIIHARVSELQSLTPMDTEPSLYRQSMYYGIKNYERFLSEVARILVRTIPTIVRRLAHALFLKRPGGLLIIIEPDVVPLVNGQFATDIRRGIDKEYAPGWTSLWHIFGKCLQLQGINTSIPRRLRNLIRGTREFSKITEQHADVPISFWQTGEDELSIAQLAWLEHDLLLPGMIPMLMNVGRMSQPGATDLVQRAQDDLYYPQCLLSTRVYVAHTKKK
ncbi:hypothetical protein HWV62_11363 [Athelia sp. TMB]|nr:hypothetical protein HWV62_11363 [Athelia sp. TMB]